MTGPQQQRTPRPETTARTQPERAASTPGRAEGAPGVRVDDLELAAGADPDQLERLDGAVSAVQRAIGAWRPEGQDASTEGGGAGPPAGGMQLGAQPDPKVKWTPAAKLKLGDAFSLSWKKATTTNHEIQISGETKTMSRPTHVPGVMWNIDFALGAIYAGPLVPNDAWSVRGTLSATPKLTLGPDIAGLLQLSVGAKVSLDFKFGWDARARKPKCTWAALKLKPVGKAAVTARKIAKAIGIEPVKKDAIRVFEKLDFEGTPIEWYPAGELVLAEWNGQTWTYPALEAFAKWLRDVKTAASPPPEKRQHGADNAWNAMRGGRLQHWLDTH